MLRNALVPTFNSALRERSRYAELKVEFKVQNARQGLRSRVE